MKYLRAFFIAAAMYSRLPVPNVRWDEESKEAVLFLFPLLGVIEAGLIYLLAGLLLRVSAGAPLSAFCLTAAPLLFTGGIHFDGFLDTADALGSWKGKEEKLAILKDVHAGSAAVLQGGLMLLAGFAAWLSLLESGNMPERLPQLLPIFLMSRALSALSIYLLPNARGAGTVYDFTAARARRMGRLLSGFYLLLAAAALFGAGTLFTGACILAAGLLAALFSGAPAAPPLPHQIPPAPPRPHALLPRYAHHPHEPHAAGQTAVLRTQGHRGLFEYRTPQSDPVEEISYCVEVKRGLLHDEN